MKKLVSLFLALVFLVPMLSLADQMKNSEMSLQNPEIGVINAWQKSMVGVWKGEGQMVDMQTSEAKPYQATVTIKPVLQDRFIQMKEEATFNSGQTFQGESLSNYNPVTDKYSMTWFDSKGWGGNFQGQRVGNVLTYHHQNPDSSIMTLNCESINSDTEKLTMKIEKPGEEAKVIGEITYTRISHEVPPEKTQTQQITPTY